MDSGASIFKKYAASSVCAPLSPYRTDNISNGKKDVNMLIGTVTAAVILKISVTDLSISLKPCSALLVISGSPREPTAAASDGMRFVTDKTTPDILRKATLLYPARPKNL